jgi:hypothetical protein
MGRLMSPFRVTQIEITERVFTPSYEICQILFVVQIEQLLRDARRKNIFAHASLNDPLTLMTMCFQRKPAIGKRRRLQIAPQQTAA